MSAQEISVPIRDTSELGNPLFDDFVARCYKGLPGFSHRTKSEATQLFNSRETTAMNTLGSLRTPYRDTSDGFSTYSGERFTDRPTIANVRSRIPLRATLLSFDTAVSYPKLEQYLHSTSQQLAPMEALLSMLLTNCRVTLGYEVTGITGKVRVAGDCRLKIAGIKSGSFPTIISEGGLIRESGNMDERPRLSLFGARLTPEGFEFFLPYVHRESGLGWPPGTLFLVEDRR